MKRKKSLLREYAETIIWAFIIAMIIRTFVVQAFKIPTGSMEPTLHGDPRYGDRIFVNKFIYRFMPPRRGDVIVFATRGIPGLGRHKDYIKRLIGLPGDTVEIRNGNVYINGHVPNHPKIRNNTYFNSRPVIKDIGFSGWKRFRIPKSFFLVWVPDRGDFYLLSSMIYTLSRDIKQGDVFSLDTGCFNPMGISSSYKTEFIAGEGQLIEFRDDGIYVDRLNYRRNYNRNHLYVIQGQYGMENRRITIPADSYFALGDNSENSKDSRYWGIVPKKNLKGRTMFIWWPPKRWTWIK